MKQKSYHFTCKGRTVLNIFRNVTKWQVRMHSRSIPDIYLMLCQFLGHLPLCFLCVSLSLVCFCVSSVCHCIITLLIIIGIQTGLPPISTLSVHQQHQPAPTAQTSFLLSDSCLTSCHRSKHPLALAPGLCQFPVHSLSSL